MDKENKIYLITLISFMIIIFLTTLQLFSSYISILREYEDIIQTISWIGIGGIFLFYSIFIIIKINSKEDFCSLNK